MVWNTQRRRGLKPRRRFSKKAPPQYPAPKMNKTTNKIRLVSCIVLSDCCGLCGRTLCRNLAKNNSF